MSLRKRRQKAEELGIPEAQIEAAEESDAPKEALLELLLSPRSPAAPNAAASAAAGLRVELESLSIRKLLKRAAELGVPEADTDEAEESKERMVELLVAWAGDDAPPTAAAAVPLPAWLEEVKGLAWMHIILSTAHPPASPHKPSCAVGRP